MKLIKYVIRILIIVVKNNLKMPPSHPEKHHRRSIQLQRYDDSQEIFYLKMSSFFTNKLDK